MFVLLVFQAGDAVRTIDRIAPRTSAMRSGPAVRLGRTGSIAADWSAPRAVSCIAGVVCWAPLRAAGSDRRGCAERRSRAGTQIKNARQFGARATLHRAFPKLLICPARSR